MNYTPSPEAIEAAEDALWNALPWPAGKSAKVPLDMMHDPAVAALAAAVPIELAELRDRREYLAEVARDAWMAYWDWDRATDEEAAEHEGHVIVDAILDALLFDDWDARHGAICARGKFCSAHRPGYDLPGEGGQP